jgi:hypothetical protein
MNDLTLLYYTANTIKEDCAVKVRDKLIETTRASLPIVCVSQRPIDFGDVNICVGEIGQSAYNCYKQIFIAAQQAKTRYVACAEDDTFYNMEHFNHRLSEKGFVCYNSNMWFLNSHAFWKRMSHQRLTSGMFGCIVEAELLVKILGMRFEKHPNEPVPPPDTPKDMWVHDKKRIQANWQEPGRFDRSLGCPSVAVEYFETADPIIVLNRHNSLGGRRRHNIPGVVMKKEIPMIGECGTVWNYYMGANVI